MLAAEVRLTVKHCRSPADLLAIVFNSSQARRPGGALFP